MDATLYRYDNLNIHEKLGYDKVRTHISIFFFFLFIRTSTKRIKNISMTNIRAIIDRKKKHTHIFRV